MKILTKIGEDSFNRNVYQDIENNLYCDTNLMKKFRESVSVFTKLDNEFNGEPCNPSHDVLIADKDKFSPRTFYSYSDENVRGERLYFELNEWNCEDCNCAKLWAKYGYTKTVLKSYFSVETYVYNEKGECFGAYNPTVKNNHKLDFDWVLEINEENRTKLINEIIRRFNEK